ncbi:MAG: hypothetical protein E7070_04970 [Bacteroidales bacterium]|jgi:thiol-disulfide isomerase/thioredoxin|nr:hypothetical protein [Bacteroidales bacterium]
MKRILFSMLFGVVASAMTMISHAETVWNNVVTGYVNTSNLAITKVTLYGDRAELGVRINYRAGNWIRIAADSYLLANGRKYAVKDATVIKLGEKFDMVADTMDFVLTFEPLPMEVTSFEFVEPHGWNVINIRNAESVPEGIVDTYWRNVATGDWYIGFAEKHVVFDCRVWDVACRLDKKDGSCEVILADGRVIKVGKLKKGQRSIAIEGKKSVVCRPFLTKALPDYPTKDERKGFVDNGYRVGDTVTVSGWLKDMPQREWRKNRYFEVSADAIFTGKFGTTFFAQIDSMGRFEVKVPLVNSTQFFFDWRRTHLSTILEPGNSYFLLFDFKTGQKIWMGSDVRLQNEMAAHSHSWDSAPLKRNTKGFDPMVYWRQADSVRNAQMAGLQQLVEKCPTISQRYVDYVTGFYRYIQGERMMQARFEADNRSLPADYMDFVTRNFLSDAARPYTLYRDFYQFMTDYLDQISMGRPFEAKPALLDSVGCEQTLRDITLCREFCRVIDNTRLPLGESMLALAESEIKLPAALAVVKEMHEKYLTLQQQYDISGSQCLKSADAFAGMINGGDILRKMIEPYKGKFVLLDIWGVWCNPCKRALAASREEFEALKDFDIVYLYLANHSGDGAWKNVIKEYNVLGDNVVHYNLPENQQMAVEQFLDVKSWPSYRLYDRDGNLVDAIADPRNVDQLKRLLQKLQAQ